MKVFSGLLGPQRDAVGNCFLGHGEGMIHVLEKNGQALFHGKGPGVDRQFGVIR